MKNLKQLYLAFILISLACITATSVELVHAQNATSPTGNVFQPATLAANSSQANQTQAKVQVFQGQLVKILSVNNFINQKQWQQVESLAAKGYEIKGIILSPSPPVHYTVVMQKKM
jgi:hypothetical protein